jgi:hypothetical protein
VKGEENGKEQTPREETQDGKGTQEQFLSAHLGCSENWWKGEKNT